MCRGRFDPTPAAATAAARLSRRLPTGNLPLAAAEEVWPMVMVVVSQHCNVCNVCNVLSLTPRSKTFRECLSFAGVGEFCLLLLMVDCFV